MAAPLGVRAWRDQPLPGPQSAARWSLVAMAFSLPISGLATDALSAVLVLLWLAAGGWSERWRQLRHDRLVAVSMALLLLIAAGISWSAAPPELAARGLARYTRLLIVPIAVSLLVAQPLWQRRVLLAFLAAMALTLVLVLAHLVHPFWLPAELGGHMVFKHYIIQSVFLSLFVLGALVIARWHASGAVRWGWYAAALLGAIIVLGVEPSRTGFIALGLVALVFLFQAPAPAHRLRWGVALIALLAVTVAMSSGMRSRVQGTIDFLIDANGSGHAQVPDVQPGPDPLEYQRQKAAASGGIRMMLWEQAAAMARERPLLGWGTGSFRVEFCRRLDADWCRLLKTSSSQPHSQFLFFAAELGVAGLALFVVLVAVPYATVRRWPPWARCPVAGTTAVFVVHSLFDSTLYLGVEGFTYPLLMSALIAVRPAGASGLAPGAPAPQDQPSSSPA
ncbi:MAG TPA: O-antigen ligase family protein [Burkholderiaceae bacterium]|nr:O-antigen ligase family protein [Burkholderiaceae bacterium]